MSGQTRSAAAGKTLEPVLRFLPFLPLRLRLSTRGRSH
jgi:hypothetical protein